MYRLALIALCSGMALAMSACQPADQSASQGAPPEAHSAPPVAHSRGAVSSAVAPDDGSAVAASVGTPAANLGEDHATARDACLMAVSRETRVDVSQLKVADVVWAEAGVGVTVAVPGTQAPWTCLSDEQGHVQGARSMEPDGGNK